MIPNQEILLEYVNGDIPSNYTNVKIIDVVVDIPLVIDGDDFNRPYMKIEYECDVTYKNKPSSVLRSTTHIYMKNYNKLVSEFRNKKISEILS